MSKHRPHHGSSSRATARRTSTRKSPGGAAVVPTAPTTAPAAATEAAPPPASPGTRAAFDAARADYVRYKDAVKVVEDLQDDLRKARRNVAHYKSRIFGLLGEELPLFEQNTI